MPLKCVDNAQTRSVDSLRALWISSRLSICHAHTLGKQQFRARSSNQEGTMFEYTY
jgi:hypothetical protein